MLGRRNVAQAGAIERQEHAASAVVEACDTLVERVRADAMERSDRRQRQSERCLGERSVDGFEILEVVQNQGGLRCAVQRCSDGYVLPTLFGPEDIRPSMSSDGRRPLVLHAPPRRVP